jgi:hypothetical protein
LFCSDIVAPLQLESDQHTPEKLVASNGRKVSEPAANFSEQSETASAKTGFALLRLGTRLARGTTLFAERWVISTSPDIAITSVTAAEVALELHSPNSKKEKRR